MPTYEYRCKTCKAQFDVVQSFLDDALTFCPNEGDSSSPKSCVTPGDGEVKKIFSTPAIIFKGQGFYKTDTQSSSNGKTDSSGDSSKSSSDLKKDSGESKSSPAKDSDKKSNTTPAS